MQEINPMYSVVSVEKLNNIWNKNFTFVILPISSGEGLALKKWAVIRFFV